jgi:hypothetical protein
VTEPELIQYFSNMSVDAIAVISMLTQYATADTNVTLTLSNGTTYTIPSLGLQKNLLEADRVADRLKFTEDFGGAVASQTVTRTPYFAIDGVVTTFASGYTLSHAYTRNADLKITTINVVVKDSLGNVLATMTKTIQRTNGLYSGII